MQNFGIIGGGAWGTALAQILRRAGRQVVLWAREAEVVEAINRARENPLFLPGVKLEAGITATGSLAEASRADVILLVPPAQHLREIATDARAAISPRTRRSSSAPRASRRRPARL